MKRFLLLTLLSIVFVFTLGCGGSSSQGGYRRISSEEAAKLMKTASGYIILDVRTPEEFKSGHIPKAINVANETIGSAMPKELPDKGQLILVYCRSGRRSKDAAQKLIKLGYTNIVDFGGIMDWKGEITR